MAAIASVSSVTSSLQASLFQQRLDAARREAAQAEANLNNLRAQTSVAEGVFQSRQERVGALMGQSAQNDPTYQSKLQSSGPGLSLKSQQSFVGSATKLSGVALSSSATSVTDVSAGASLASGTSATASTVQSRQTQGMGRVVNVTA